MTISTRGLDIIKEFESLRLTSYLDDAGIWTIGWGTTRINGVPVREGMTCTVEQAEEYIRADCRKAEADIRTLVRVPLTQNQFDALVCFVYNVGGYAFSTSTLLRLINQGKPVAEDVFTRWNKAKDPKTGELRVLNGLTRRRKLEYALFME